MARSKQIARVPAAYNATCDQPAPDQAGVRYQFQPDMRNLDSSKLVDVRLGRTILRLPPTLFGHEAEATRAVTFYAAKAAIEDARGEPWRQRATILGSITGIDHIAAVTTESIDDVTQDQKFDPATWEIISYWTSF